jgi:hypothetical protein
MEDFIDKKIKEMGDFVAVVSFNKGTDNYNKMKKILTETYERGKCGEDHLPFVDDDYPLIED